MSSHIGVTDDPVLIAAPIGGFAHESKKSMPVEVVEEKNNLGVTVYADQRGHIKGEVTVKGVGEAAFATVTAGTITVGTVKVIKAKKTKELGKRAMFEYTGRILQNGVYTEPEEP
ncbi:hypothetical protein [Verrucomicrobium spinosum]|uniref:hypothetical protein n=1 Tax=Verrucomicrobium spinosum TaxID=2736 RepID=UPI000174666C|nr:hypothetical protein [Verrucomicrobium spinosum]